MFILAEVTKQETTINLILLYCNLFFALVSVVGVVGTILKGTKAKKLGEKLEEASNNIMEQKNKAEEYAAISANIIETIEKFRKTSVKQEEKSPIAVVNDLIGSIKDQGLLKSIGEGKTVETITRALVKKVTEGIEIPKDKVE